jgi:hypothetical protein
MEIIVSKALKRKLEEDKDTAFFLHGFKITTERIENFKKRKFCKEEEVSSFTAGK